MLRTPLEEGSVIIGYADDTFVMSKAATTEDAIAKNNLQLSRVLRRIKYLGLEIAEEKTGAVVFNSNKSKAKANTNIDIYTINVNKTQIETSKNIKYRLNYR